MTFAFIQTVFMKMKNSTIFLYSSTVYTQSKFLEFHHETYVLLNRTIFKPGDDDMRQLVSLRPCGDIEKRKILLLEMRKRMKNLFVELACKFAKKNPTKI